jgi:two-component system cell cycle response regulator CtrA
VFICKLRKKLADSGVRNMISTDWGRGYAIHEPDAASHAELSHTIIPQGVPAWLEGDQRSAD